MVTTAVGATPLPPSLYFAHVLFHFFGECGARRGNTLFSSLFQCTLYPNSFSCVCDSSFVIAFHVIGYLDWSVLYFNLISTLPFPNQSELSELSEVFNCLITFCLKSIVFHFSELSLSSSPPPTPKNPSELSELSKL